MFFMLFIIVGSAYRNLVLRRSLNVAEIYYRSEYCSVRENFCLKQFIQFIQGVL